MKLQILDTLKINQSKPMKDEVRPFHSKVSGSVDDEDFLEWFLQETIVGVKFLSKAISAPVETFTSEEFIRECNSLSVVQMFGKFRFTSTACNPFLSVITAFCTVRVAMRIFAAVRDDAKWEEGNTADLRYRTQDRSFEIQSGDVVDFFKSMKKFVVGDAPTGVFMLADNERPSKKVWQGRKRVKVDGLLLLRSVTEEDMAEFREVLKATLPVVYDTVVAASEVHA